MDIAQRIRRATARFRPGPADENGASTEDATVAPEEGARRSWSRRKMIIVGVLVALALYYPLGSMLDHQVNDDVRFAPAAPSAESSRAVAAAAAMITREVDETGWVANTPPFAPNALLKYGGNMMNFQVGVITAVGVFAVELRDQLGRARGASAADADLQQAASDIQYDPERWVFRLGRVLPEAAAEDQYRNARDALESYNVRLGQGQAVFDKRADNLLAVLNRFALDLGAASAELETQIDAGRRVVFLDRQADKLFYNVKGRSYAYALILRGLRDDFADVVEERDIADLYEEMLADLEVVAAMRPAVVMNGKPSGIATNNHLAVQGFYLLRARTRLREMTDILLK